MFIGISLLIIAPLIAFAIGSSSRQGEIDELNERIADLESRIEARFGEDWEELTDVPDNEA